MQMRIGGGEERLDKMRGRIGEEVEWVRLGLKSGYFIISGELFFGRDLECQKTVV
jgi:hypothetical protein